MGPGEYLSELAERPLLRSILGGVAAYVSGILAVGALNPVDRDGSNPVVFAANRFYSAHFGQLDRTIRGPPGSDIVSIR